MPYSKIYSFAKKCKKIFLKEFLASTQGTQGIADCQMAMRTNHFVDRTF